MSVSKPPKHFLDISQFNKATLRSILDKAVEFKLGARGLRSICEAIMLDIMFETPSNKEKKKFRVTYTYAESKLNVSSL